MIAAIAIFVLVAFAGLAVGVAMVILALDHRRLRARTIGALRALRHGQK